MARFDLAGPKPMTLRSLAQPISAGLVTAFVGFASSFAVVLKGLAAVGATDAQAASGLMALSIAMGVAGVVLSVVTRMPVFVAWSTPGAALLAATGATPGGFPAAVGAFLVVGVLLVAAGLLRPFGRLIAAIPDPLANAMLAGVLFGLCLKPIGALIEAPIGASLIVLSWLIVSRWKRIYATPVAALVAGAVIAASGRATGLDLMTITPHPDFVMPTFSLDAIIGIALPLFIFTMASQNLPGLAVLGAYGFRPDPGRLIWTTGAFSVLSAPFGGHAVNLSSIAAALCASPDASPDPGKRWIAAATAGAASVVLGLFAGAVTALASGAPIFVEAVAGLALLSSFGSALHNALAQTHERESALITFLVTASGVTIYGVGGAFWGLVAGGAVLALTRAGVSLPTRQAP
jgi:benzoate membrane transport protein